MTNLKAFLAIILIVILASWLVTYLAGCVRVDVNTHDTNGDMDGKKGLIINNEKVEREKHLLKKKSE